MEARFTQPGNLRFECLCQSSVDSLVDIDATWTFLFPFQGCLSLDFLPSSFWGPSGKNEYIWEHQSGLLHCTRSFPRIYLLVLPQKSKLLWSRDSVKVKTQIKSDPTRNLSRLTSHSSLSLLNTCFISHFWNSESLLIALQTYRSSFFLEVTCAYLWYHLWYR